MPLTPPKDSKGQISGVVNMVKKAEKLKMQIGVKAILNNKYLIEPYSPILAPKLTNMRHKTYDDKPMS